MKKSVVIGLHIGFWLCYLLITIVLLSLSLKGEGNAYVDEVTERAIYFSVIPSIISYYAFYFFIFPYVQQKRFTLSVGYALAISIGASLLGNVLIYIFLGVDSLTKMQEPISTGIIFIAFVDLIIGIVALITKGFITWFEELKLKEALQQKNHEMEMALVKSQLDPHFLFNTLNNIDVLILKNATQASNYLNKLCDIMRFMLYETKTDKIPLAKEIEYIEKYIALQKIRTANANYINFKVVGIPSGKTIAPMIFLPFIENAFKHATNKKLDNAILVHIFIEEEGIKFRCKNKFNPNRRVKQGDNGLGNELIEKRLNLIYPAQHILEIRKEATEYSVNLTIFKG